jgi:hypothetical protein
MNDEPDFTPSAATGTATDEAPTRRLVTAAAGDRCVVCGTPLAGDQRYCVNCGERRGKPRFSVASPSGTGLADVSGTPPPPAPRAPRASSGATIVAGVGTLLLAMGVGVLIGHNTASTPKQVAAAPPTVVTINGGGSAPTTTAASTTPSRAAKHGSTSKGSSKSKSKSKSGAKPSAADAAKASNAASKVLGSSNTNLPPATVTQGQTGSGPGYNKTTKKFDGSFFGQ